MLDLNPLMYSCTLLSIFWLSDFLSMFLMGGWYLPSFTGLLVTFTKKSLTLSLYFSANLSLISTYGWPYLLDFSSPSFRWFPYPAHRSSSTTPSCEWTDCTLFFTIKYNKSLIISVQKYLWFSDYFAVFAKLVDFSHLWNYYASFQIFLQKLLLFPRLNSIHQRRQTFKAKQCYWNLTTTNQHFFNDQEVGTEEEGI